MLFQAGQQNNKYVLFMTHDTYIIQNQPEFYTGSQITRLLSDHSLPLATVAQPHVINVNNTVSKFKSEDTDQDDLKRGDFILGLVHVDLANVSMAEKFKKYDDVYVARDGKCGL